MPDARPDARHVDGNALGGVLAEVFAADLTRARTTCAGCRAVAPLAELHVYLDAPGVVARCPGCGHVQLRVAHHEPAVWLDLSGALVVEIPREALPDAG